MKFPLPRPLFPQLSVAPADDDALVALVDVFVDKLLIEERAFRSASDATVDTSKWKFMRHGEHAAVYRARTSSQASSSSAFREVASKKDPTTKHLIPPFLVVGHVPGALDDLLYGFTAPTREATLIKTSYVDDSVADADVLRCLRRPSVDAPFSHVTLKWFVVSSRAAIVAPRDFVYVDAIGTRVLEDGTRIGYRFSHSVKLKGAEPMTANGFLRSNFSICTIFRESQSQDSDGTGVDAVHVYGRAFFELCGAIPRAIYTFVVSLQVSSAAAQLRNGQLKKLALALRHKDRNTWTVAVRPSAQETMCGVCTKSLRMFNTSRSACALCERTLCHTCRIRDVLSFLHADGMSVQRLRVAFCRSCRAQAIQLPSAMAATEEFVTDTRDFYCMPKSLGEAAAAPASSLRNLFSK